MKFKLIDQIVRPKGATGGVNWSNDRLVLVRIGKKELWWAKGQTYRQGVSSEYFPCELQLIEDGELHDKRHSSTEQRLHEGGRLSRKVIVAHSDAINAFFNATIATYIDPKATLINDLAGPIEADIITLPALLASSAAKLQAEPNWKVNAIQVLADNQDKDVREKVNMGLYKSPAPWPSKDGHDYMAQRDLYNELEWELIELFKRDALIELVVASHAKAEVLWSIAWREGHSNGLHEVLNYLEDLSNLVEPTIIEVKQLLTASWQARTVHNEQSALRGHSPEEAVGKLIMANEDILGISIHFVD